MALTTQFVKLKIDSTTYCIKDFPDIDPYGNPDQVETTTLCDEFHQFIDGLKNYGDELEFTANYDEANFNTLNGLTNKAVEILLCSSSSDATGANGKFAMTTADIRCRLKGAGVGDVLEMVIVVKPTSAITFSQVS